MKRILRFAGALLLFTAALYIASRAQEQPAKPDVAAYIQREFGQQFKLVPTFTPMTADLNRDGEEDLVVVASGDSPMFGEGDFNYKVADPYHASFGYGDPKITMSFSTSDHSNFILIAHSWLKTSKPKFVLVNVPFDKVQIAGALMKKKRVPAIQATDLTGVQGAIYWDGKKYKWEAVGMAE